MDYEFHDGRFTETTIPIKEDPSGDYGKSLYASGWSRHISLPGHDEGEFNNITAVVYDDCDFPGRSGPVSHLVDVWAGDSGLCLIRCPNAIDLITLLRDWIYPLCAYADLDYFMGRLHNLTHYLTDPQTGIEYVRNGMRRERELREYYAQRKAMAQKKEVK